MTSATAAQLDYQQLNWLQPVDEAMRALVDEHGAQHPVHYGMIRYHLGWVDEDLTPCAYAGGKRFRPQLCLLACASVGGNPEAAVPAAAAIELLHNFTLVHDDIMDGSAFRRGRPSVWGLWGEAQAINVGDCLFALSTAAMLDLEPVHGGTRTLASLRRFNRACLQINEGQHLDLRPSEVGSVTEAEYLPMIRGKTAALLSASVSLGASLGGCSLDIEGALSEFAECAGMAFQMQDDMLDLWGDPTMTGQTPAGDLQQAKRTLPIVYALQHPQLGPRLQAVLGQELVDTDLAMRLIEDCGAREHCLGQIRAYLDRSRQALHRALGPGAAHSPMWQLFASLIRV